MTQRTDAERLETVGPFLSEILHAPVHHVADTGACVFGAEGDEVVHDAHGFVAGEEAGDIEGAAEVDSERGADSLEGVVSGQSRDAASDYSPDTGRQELVDRPREDEREGGLRFVDRLLLCHEFVELSPDICVDDVRRVVPASPSLLVPEHPNNGDVIVRLVRISD